MTSPYEKPTGAPPRTVAGHVWRCYRIGTLRFEWRPDGADCSVSRRHNANTYWARAGGEYLPTRFRSEVAAMKAAVKRAEAAQ